MLKHSLVVKHSYLEDINLETACKNEKVHSTKNNRLELSCSSSISLVNIEFNLKK